MPAISTHVKGMVAERHGMPKRSDDPLPPVDDLQMRDGKTLERYQSVVDRTPRSCIS